MNAPKMTPMLTPEAAHKIGEDLLAILNKVAKTAPQPTNQVDLPGTTGEQGNAAPDGKQPASR